MSDGYLGGVKSARGGVRGRNGTSPVLVLAACSWVVLLSPQSPSCRESPEAISPCCQDHETAP